MSDLISVVTDQLPLLAVLVAAVAIAAIAASAATRMHGARYRLVMADKMMEQSKLQMVQRQQLLRDYANAAVVLSDAEKARIDAINEDLATLSRRAIAMMSEVDARTTRLERGVEIAKMSGQLDAIRENESRLFAGKA